MYVHAFFSGSEMQFRLGSIDAVDSGMYLSAIEDAVPPTDSYCT